MGMVLTSYVWPFTTNFGYAWIIFFHISGLILTDIACLAKLDKL